MFCSLKTKQKKEALIRKEGNSFQSASIIVMRAKFPNGYKLKKFSEQKIWIAQKLMSLFKKKRLDKLLIAAHQSCKI